ncbi:AN1-type zinc finger protein 1-like [Ostrinia furnacalis]|uniref:AN1-type zinc finger protein 1-like n=1 Tax=Ostrinia furnacalis TaxID=93504 RepID=UPI00103BC0B7|nr:AN1-type zinc finger protein 1-like [Ostrinia furnacalis]
MWDSVATILFRFLQAAMEFPDLGEHCQKAGCNQTDFLPLQCKCGKVLCRVHFLDHCTSSECELAPKPKEVNLKSDDQIFKCSEKGCRKGNLHEMLCGKCKKHYCIEHRFHPTCPEIDDETMAAKIEQFEAPRKQFQLANQHLQETITENIRKALQSSAKVKTASKIHLMRIKQKAVGPKSVPVSDRVYFAIGKPKNMEPKTVKVIDDVNNLVKIDNLNLDPDLKGAVGVFVSTKWSLGRAIDSICDSSNITNNNNRMEKVKLRLFRQLDGYCISPIKMDVEIGDLMKQEVLIEGDKLIIEYIDTNILRNLDEHAQIFLS